MDQKQSQSGKGERIDYWARGWDEAIKAVEFELRCNPPSKIGEAAFLRRLQKLKGQNT